MKNLVQLTEVLPSPDVHLKVVSSNLLEVGLVDHEQAAGNHRGLDRLAGVQLPGPSLDGRQILPLENLKSN